MVPLKFSEQCDTKNANHVVTFLKLRSFLSRHGGGFVQKTSNNANEKISVDTKNDIPLKIPQDTRTEMVSGGIVKKVQTVDT